MKKISYDAILAIGLGASIYFYGKDVGMKEVIQEHESASTCILHMYEENLARELSWHFQGPGYRDPVSERVARLRNGELLDNERVSWHTVKELTQDITRTLKRELTCSERIK